MKILKIKVITLAVTLAFSACAMAEGMLSKADYSAGKEKISVDYKAAKAACASLSGNASDICVADAKGKKEVAKADIQIHSPAADGGNAVTGRTQQFNVTVNGKNTMMTADQLEKLGFKFKQFNGRKVFDPEYK